MKEKKCKVCGTVYNTRKHTCSEECGEGLRIAREYLKWYNTTRECVYCRKRFVPSPSLLKRDKWKKNFCCIECRNEHFQLQLSKSEDSILMNCRGCGKPRYVDKKYKDSKAIFCNKECKYKFNNNKKCSRCGKIGKPFSGTLCLDCFILSFATKCNNCGEVLKKNRKYLISPEKYDFLIKQYGKLPYMKVGGDEFRKLYQLSSTRYCNIQCIIEKESPYYYEGISEEEYPFEFNDPLKQRILNRDKNTCQLCGSTNRLAIHHIDYDKNNNIPLNFITLCNSCHTKTNYHRKMWVKLFSNFIVEWFGE